MNYSTNPLFRYRKFGGNHLLISMAEAIEINEVGAEIWLGLKNQTSVAEIKRDIASHYSIAFDHADQDVDEYLSTLMAYGAIHTL
ncbi:PqqD family protein [Vibrio tubiashii]|uniref:PqqD family protein n=1 Tax=Vibrio tubiashii ATCC 19109 TaxID=1051646 RepID=F9T4F0_9VIBR|nr:PqqD family protein [Vibrio tubiashii]AIW13324.1 hypothetical protein IX91_03770 [Vibrio tubiashii ATCC 19109]EGU56061.1 hypothetical protein VITU9109_08872 [Vibrio tubiashii ATCC 19109]EIF04460.1 hypothetical protein VT1337_08316 [Vibrio tubiashii NCIMB 1337 = ATCC 19106]